MRTSRTAGTLVVVAVCLSLAAVAFSDGEPVKLAPKLASVLSAAQNDLKNNRPAQALTRLSAFVGKDHALRHLMMGQAYAQLSKLPDAEKSFHRALEMDAGLKQAGIALGQVYYLQDNLPKAVEFLGRYLSTDSCDGSILLLYAQVARKKGDTRLCRLLVTKGIVRFPQDLRFRRLDLAVTIDEGEYLKAGGSARRLLVESPGDARLWQQLAYASGRAAESLEQLAALEASLLCEPEDLDKHRQFITALLSRGDWATVVKHGRLLLSGSLRLRATVDMSTMDLLIRAADMGGEDKLVGTWLKLVPQKSRTRVMRLAEAHSALRRGDIEQARRGLRKLIASGEVSAGVFLWAGHLSEKSEDYAEAETYYDQARKLTGRSSHLGTLYLARLWFLRGQNQRSVELLQSYLDANPEDAPARALLALARSAPSTAERTNR